ncbi:hypothetical protein HGP28_04110 [Vibrio sp. SM6]|uniref:Bacterial transcriptional activator domain-containing protein n=2 Tax=Vibrio agarilyticus TaxID=2726741 RepID=A0A7X8TP39_9VIBR|nr:hypothetical protein [Vibrio agarilyticus]NLS12077.1 hypothetical protein [Vibrio agarilyticus]
MLALSLSLTFAAQGVELSQYTAARVQKAHQLAQDEKYAAAIDSLRALELSRAYDKAFVARMLGVFYWQNEQPEQAIEQLELAVNSDELRDEQGWHTRKMLADLLLNQQAVARALPHYYDLVVNVPENEDEASLWLRIAQSQYQLQVWDKTLHAIERYEKIEPALSKPPLSLKLSAELELQQWRAAIVTIKQLISLEPQHLIWWRQLAALQLRISDESGALDSYVLAQLQGVALEDNDFVIMAQLYAKRGIPEQAASTLALLENAQQNTKLLAQQASYWQLAKEWRNAAEFWALAAKKDSQYYWPHAQILLQEGQYQAALVSLDQVKDRELDVALARTRALYKLDQLNDALHQAKRAQALAEQAQVSTAQSKGWVTYLSQLLRSRE